MKHNQRNANCTGRDWIIASQCDILEFYVCENFAHIYLKRIALAAR